MSLSLLSRIDEYRADPPSLRKYGPCYVLGKSLFSIELNSSCPVFHVAVRRIAYLDGHAP
jgi:hypothetical protein